MSTDLERLADRVMDEMLRFGEGVIEYQTRDLHREDHDYSVLGFDIVCQCFMAGAMLVISERYELPTPPREVALLGLLNYLSTKKGWKFEAARARVAVINEAGPGSIGHTVFDGGYRHWRRPDALATLIRSEKPTEWWSESWIECNKARSMRIVRRLGVAVGAIVLLVAGWLLGRVG